MESYRRLEIAWAEFNGVHPDGMVVCASGTAALHLAWEALRLPPHSAVIVPDFTMIACARSVSLAGLRPVFVDVRREDLNLNQSLLSQVDGIPFGLLLVHTYGRVCRPADTTLDWLRRMNAVLVEDLAEAHGVKPHPAAHASCWSFYKNKVVAGEEGGSVYFPQKEHAALARQLRCQGFTEAHDFWHIPRGHNYRLANCLADLILQSLEDYHQNVQERRRRESRYEERCPKEWRMPARRDVPWVYDLRIPGLSAEGLSRVVHGLRTAGISRARCGFKPLHCQEEYRGAVCWAVPGPAGTGVESIRASHEILYLPLDMSVTEETARLAFDASRFWAGA